MLHFRISLSLFNSCIQFSKAAVRHAWFANGLLSAVNKCHWIGGGLGSCTLKEWCFKTVGKHGWPNLSVFLLLAINLLYILLISAPELTETYCYPTWAFFKARICYVLLSYIWFITVIEFSVQARYIKSGFTNATPLLWGSVVKCGFERRSPES